MPVVMCFGDSNTHGTPPATDLDGSGRYPPGQRWPDALGAALGDGWTVLNEGLPGRTTVLDDHIDGAWKNGLRVLPASLHTHKPIDLVILMLGTNDLKARHSRNAFDIADGVRRLIKEVRVQAAGPGDAPSDILVITPTPIRETGPFAELFAGAEPVSCDLPRAFAEMGAQMGVRVFDAGSVIEVDPRDGVHFSADSLIRLGQAVAEVVREMMAP